MSPATKNRKRPCVRFGSCNGKTQTNQSRYTNLGCKVEGTLWKENFIIDKTLQRSNNGILYHKPLNNRVRVHRLFQNIDQHIKSKIFGYFIYSFRLVSYHGESDLYINGSDGPNSVKMEKLLEPIKIRLLLLRICDHDLIKSDITEGEIREIVSDIKDFDNSKIDSRFEVVAEMKKVIQCSNTCTLINHERVDFCYNFGEKDCIVDNADDVIKYQENNFIFVELIDNVPSAIDLRMDYLEDKYNKYKFGKTRDLSVGDIGISAYYSDKLMVELYQEDYGVSGNMLEIMKTVAKDWREFNPEINQDPNDNNDDDNDEDEDVDGDNSSNKRRKLEKDVDMPQV